MAALALVAALAGCAAPAGQRHPTPTPHPAVCTFPGHIYHPARLRLLGCRTVTGTAVSRRTEPDGDYHVRFRLDPPYTSLLTAANRTYQAGTLVVEEPCQHGVTQPDAVAACAGWSSPWLPLVAGKRYRLTGNYVLDLQHHSWAELHGLAEVEAIG